MKPSSFLGRRGISPVMATIILVAVTLVIAVSSSFYYTSVVGAYNSFEEIEVRTVKVYHVNELKWPTNNVFEGSGWNVSITLKCTGMSMTLKSTGTKQVTIKRLLLNGRPLDAYDRVAIFDGNEYVKTGDISFPIEYGSSRQIFIAIKKGNDKSSGIIFTPGLNLEVKLQSASGITLSRFINLT